MRLSVILPKHWAKEFNKVITQGVDAGFILHPHARHYYKEITYKSEEQFFEVLSSIEKNLHLKTFEKSILQGPMFRRPHDSVICNIMTLWKETSQKWQPIFDLSRSGELGSLGPNSFVQKMWRGLVIIDISVFKNLCRNFSFGGVRDVSSAFAHLKLKPSQKRCRWASCLDWYFQYTNMAYRMGITSRVFLFIMQTLCEICRPICLIAVLMI